MEATVPPSSRGDTAWTKVARILATSSSALPYHVPGDYPSSSLWPPAREGWLWAKMMFYLRELHSLRAQMISPFLSSPGVGVNPYCTGETDFLTTKKSAASADRQPYSLCSGRKSLSQQLDFSAAKFVVRMKGGELQEEGVRGGLPEEPSWRFDVHRVTVVRS